MVSHDELGPEKILEVYDAKTGMHGFVVIDNTALGPGKGGIRMTPTVSVDEVAKLARAMTYKCSLAGLPFGGGKSGIVADPRKMTPEQKDAIIAAFSKALKVVCPKLYVSAPDINTAEHEMKVFAEANGSMKSCTGKPKDMGGIPHELGSTGFGVHHATLVAVKHLKLDINDLTFAVEGFGNVGWFAAKFLTEKGAKLVATSDSKGLVYVSEGMDFNKLVEIKKDKGTVTAYPGGQVLKGEEIVGLPVDILVTAAVPDLITEANKDSIKAKIVVEGSNIPTTADIEQYLHEKGILVVPDFVANAGGVISSFVEYKGGTPEKMFKMVESKVVKNTTKVLRVAKKQGIKPRDAAIHVAIERIKKKTASKNLLVQKTRVF